jgi:hypothetical protein
MVKSGKYDTILCFYYHSYPHSKRRYIKINKRKVSTIIYKDVDSRRKSDVKMYDFISLFFSFICAFIVKDFYDIFISKQIRIYLNRYKKIVKLSVSYVPLRGVDNVRKTRKN